MKITIIGTGYVGLVTGVCLAEKGHDVVCFDKDVSKIDLLRNGISPIYEDGIEALMNRNHDRISYTANEQEAYLYSNVIFIAVGTPEKKDGSANLSFVWEAVDSIIKNVNNDSIIIIKSTVPIGTNQKIEEYMNKNGNYNSKYYVVSNPEFLSQGTAIKDTMYASRIVIGANDNYAFSIMKEVYKDFPSEKLYTDRQSAEMIKYASNDFLALKISYINEIANLCELVGADVTDVAKGMGLDARIGNQFLRAGIGYGGSCFPKDTKALHWLSNYYDKELKTVRAAIEVNEEQKLILIQKARKYFNSFKGLKICVLGLTFKPGTDDLRDAPSLVNIPIFLEDGANVYAYDPVGIRNYKKYYPNEITYCTSTEEALKDADICFIFTEWEEFKKLTWQDFQTMKTPIVMDGRNCFDLDVIRTVPMIYESIGRCAINNISK